jgi:regulator of RNase E activity RraA
VNVTIQCAGVSVLPGDIIVIDGNGVVVVPMEEAAAILQRAQRLLCSTVRSLECGLGQGDSQHSPTL